MNVKISSPGAVPPDQTRSSSVMPKASLKKARPAPVCERNSIFGGTSSDTASSSIVTLRSMSRIRVLSGRWVVGARSDVEQRGGDLVGAAGEARGRRGDRDCGRGPEGVADGDRGGADALRELLAGHGDAVPGRTLDRRHDRAAIGRRGEGVGRERAWDD